MRVQLALLPGDGIGPEIIDAARSVLGSVAERFGHVLEYSEHPVGGAALDQGLEPLPAETLAACRESDAILLGAVGGPRWSDPSLTKRPEQGLLALRRELGLFANLRPIVVRPALAEASPIKSDRLEQVDMLFVRELSSGIYYGAREIDAHQARDECRYTTHEISRCIRVAAGLARQRRGRLTLVDKANVLDTSRLWRRTTQDLVAAEYPDLELEILLVDAMAMHLLERPASFDVIVTENLFGDVLTDEAAMLAGSLGVLPSASLGEGGPGLFEPAHGSAPELAGKDQANPVATLLSVAMLLEHGLGLEREARCLTRAIDSCVEAGLCTADIGGRLGTRATARAVSEALLTQAAVA